MMNNLLTLKSHKNNGAVISLTSEYLLIQGRYYEIVNGYVQTVKETRSLCVNEILQVYTTYIRSRRLLFAFMFPLVIVSIIYSVLLTYINSICIVAKDVMRGSRASQGVMVIKDNNIKGIARIN